MERSGDLYVDLLTKQVHQELAYQDGCDYLAWKAQIKEKFEELLGIRYIRENTCPLNFRMEEEKQKDGYIVRIAKDGTTAELLWGYKDGGKFTSEFPAHMMSHIARLSVDPDHKVVMHSHPTYTIAMNTICSTNEKEFTHKLWQSNTECVVVFPDGVGVLPCMVCGTNEIGEATAEKMKKFRLVVWTNHGIYGTGKTMDEAFGLIETVEKTAQIYMIAKAGGQIVNVIPDEIIRDLAKLWGLTPLEGVLSV